MIKRVPILLGIALLSGMVSAQMTKEGILSELTRSHKSTFGHKNLFDKNINSASWDNTLEILSNYVERSAGDDKTLLLALNLCNEASKELVRNIRVWYRVLLSHSKKNGKFFVTEGDIEDMKVDLEEIYSGKAMVSRFWKEIKSSLNGTAIRLDEIDYVQQSKKDAKELLLVVVDLLLFTINKTMDFHTKLESLAKVAQEEGLFFTQIMTKEGISNKIMFAHESVFRYKLASHHNLFDQGINFGLWEDALNNLDSYVEQNRMGNSKLLIAFGLCRGIGLNFIEVIPQTREVFSQGSFVTDEEVEKVKVAIATLMKRKKDLQNQKNILESTTFYISAQKKNDVKEVLLAVIALLGGSIDKIARNFDALAKKYHFV